MNKSLAFFIITTTTAMAIPTDTLEDRLEALGAIMWYSKECKNTIPEVEKLINSKLKFHNLVEDPEFNDDISNGMNKAWLAGCERIKSKALELGYSNYLICKSKDIMDDDGFVASGCLK